MTNAQFAVEVGLLVRRAREGAALTQAQLCERSGIAAPHLSRLESGVHLPSLKTVKRVADALGLAVRDLMPPRPARKTRKER